LARTTAVYTPITFYLLGPTFLSSKINVGDKAPDFTLPDTEMKPRSLKEFMGQKIVLAETGVIVIIATVVSLLIGAI
jgi:hypothetical protein